MPPLGTQVSIAFNKRLGTRFFSECEGFILQRLRGDGMAFVHAGGTVVKKVLRNENPAHRYRLYCRLYSRAWTTTSSSPAGLKSMFFGGEGLFLATLSGTGTVLLQSMPFAPPCRPNPAPGWHREHGRQAAGRGQ